MKNPKVTVLMSVYNGEQYLCEAIDSILNQTFKDFEFIIINDSSTDKTGEILENYNDPRIKIINNDKNIGLTKSLNKGIVIAKGEYIARQDADDISMPERLQKEVEFLAKNKNVGLVGTDSSIINEKGKVVHAVKCITDYIELKIKLLEGNQLTHSSVMFRKECIYSVGNYREEFKFAQDYDFYLRIAELCDIANISESLVKWRISTKSISVTKKALQDKYALLAIELAKERKQLGKDKLQSLKQEEIDKFVEESISSGESQNNEEGNNGYFYYGIILLNGRDYKGALKLLLIAFIIQPLCINNWFLLLKTILILLLPRQIVNCLRIVKNYKFK